MSGSRIRKQVYDLTVADLDQHGVWEFALDEEGEEGQDDRTTQDTHPFTRHSRPSEGAGRREPALPASTSSLSSGTERPEAIGDAPTSGIFGKLTAAKTCRSNPAPREAEKFRIQEDLVSYSLAWA